MYRELYEEIGLKRDDVTILATSRNWLKVSLTQTTRPLGQFTGLYWPEAEMVLLQLDPGKESRISLTVMVTRNLMIGVGSTSVPGSSGRLLQAGGLPPGDEEFAAGRCQSPWCRLTERWAAQPLALRSTTSC